jgi:hypothetical protein
VYAAVSSDVDADDRMGGLGGSGTFGTTLILTGFGGGGRKSADRFLGGGRITGAGGGGTSKMSDHRLSASGACDGLGRLGGELGGVDSAGSCLICLIGLTSIRLRSAGGSAVDFCFAIVFMSWAGGSNNGCLGSFRVGN